MAEPENEPAPVEPGQDPTKPPAAPQQPADGPPEGGESKVPEGLVPRAVLDEAIGTRQAAKERAELADAANAELKNQLAAMPSADELEAYKAWNSDKNRAARDKAMKDGDVEAIENGVREPLMAQIESLKSTLTNRNAQLTSVLRSQALQSAAAECGAHSPNQVVTLLQARVRMTEQSDGAFVPEFLDADGQPAYDGASQRITDPKVFVAMFLAQPENANLVTSHTVPGSGARPAGGQQATGDDGMPATVAEYNALDDDKKAEVMAKLGSEGMKRLLGAGEEEIPNTL